MIENIYENGYEPRIYIPKDSISYTRLTETQSVVKDLKTRYPEILSLCVFGSNIKGKATKESDIDGWLFVDSEILSKGICLDESNIIQQDIDCKNRNQGICFKEDIGDFYNNLIQSEVKKKLNLSDTQVKDLRTIPISKYIIDYHLKDYSSWVKKRIISPNTFYHCLNTGYIPYIFHLAIGQGIEEYRLYLIMKLLNMRKKGELIWTEIISGVEIMENRYYTINNIKYPKTLYEAMNTYSI
ncbi:nucleotidyltransferase domain-containing protein [Candidatus Dojkabacteria bacterium]|nr:nucleotidyltransferase domain-containing protein [Candidatus Dojkabacteria bacterium]